MYITPPCRRRGFGRALLEAAVAHTRALAGVRQVKLGVNAANAPARALYQSLGFVSYGVELGALLFDGRFHDEERYLLRFEALA